MREFECRMMIPEKDGLAKISQALDELAIHVGGMPDEDGHIAILDDDEKVIGFAQVTTTDVEFRYAKTKIP